MSPTPPQTCLQTLNDKYPYLLAILLCLGVILYAFGCDPKTKSLIDPLQRVSRFELQLEIDSLIAQSEIRFAELEQQEKLKAFLFQRSIEAASTGIVNPMSLITSLLTLLSGAAVTDNIRLRRTRKKLAEEL